MSHPEIPQNENTTEDVRQNADDGLSEPFGEGKKALVIEDDPTTAELIRKLLAERLFEVRQAKNGKDAWDKIRPDFRPDIIICDFLMPEMNGFEFFKGLKDSEETRNIPVVFLSARKNMKDSLLALGAESFLDKPLDKTIFLETVKTEILRKPSPPEESPDADNDSQEKES